MSQIPQVNNILVAGVGGQGILLATDVIADVFLEAGFDAKKSEVHGMAQRGGSVESHVRRAQDTVYSPLIGVGDADALLALEKLEALRYAHMVKPDGIIIFDTQETPPLSVSLQEATYPEDIEDRLQQITPHIVPVEASTIALELSNPKVSNVVLLGALSQFMDIDEAIWEKILEFRVPPKAITVNKKAFVLGKNSA